MNRGLMYKAAMEIWPATLMCGVLVFGVEGLLAYVLPTFQEQFSDTVRQIRFVQTFVSAMLGVKTLDNLGVEAFLAFPWVHPVVLAVVWAHPVQWCTRVPAGEIDRGTADVLFTLPVTRWQILKSETVVGLTAGLIVLLLAAAGNFTGTRYVDPDLRPAVDRLFMVDGNLFCLYIAVAGVTLLVSSLCSRRGVAIAIAFSILLTSLLLNVLAQFWEPADKVSFLGLLYYYQPLYILRDGIVPWRNLGVLVAVGTVCWTAAGAILARRDISTI